MAEAEKQKTCFVIAPIDKRGSDGRIRSNQVFDHIIEPVVSELGYKAGRADKIPDPGMITDQIIERLLDDDLVVADLTNRNANVFYELAIRHAIRRPTVIMIADGEEIPFDLSQSRAIQFDYRDLDSVAACKTELENQIRSLEQNPDNMFSPISTAIDLRTMRESGDPSAQRDAKILQTLQALQADVNRLERQIDNPESRLLQDPTTVPSRYWIDLTDEGGNQARVARNIAAVQRRDTASERSARRRLEDALAKEEARRRRPHEQSAEPEVEE